MRTAFVTGGSGGIGQAVVRALCDAGYNVTFTYCRSAEKAASFARSVYARAVFCDLTDSGCVNAVAQAFVQQCGAPDVLVNCAGISEWGLFDMVSDEQWNRLRGTNLDGVFYVCRAFVPFMLGKKSGSIVNIGSVWGETGASCEVAYSATKAGVSGLTKALAKELAPSGITVNCVAPGAVKTSMMDRFSETEIKELCEEIPVGRLAEPAEIAQAVLFLANAPYITGQCLGVNGGLYI
ncbi:MAG: 3-oxoacyl-ACP reductase FabG [Clostridia bacterium]|nr:3-oxoacyl-ACP reductase FabG [Clostridia bacterium]